MGTTPNDRSMRYSNQFYRLKICHGGQSDFKENVTVLEASIPKAGFLRVICEAFEGSKRFFFSNIWRYSGVWTLLDTHTINTLSLNFGQSKSINSVTLLEVSKSPWIVWKRSRAMNINTTINDSVEIRLQTRHFHDWHFSFYALLLFE